MNRLLKHWTLLTLPAKVPSQAEAIQIETTTLCNLECYMCPRTWAMREHRQDSDRWKQIIDVDAFRYIVEQLPYLRRVGLNGLGEPLLNPEILDILDYCRRVGIDASLTSNGLTLDPSLFRELIRVGLTQLTVSLDGASNKVYSNIRVGSSLNVVKRNLASMAEVSKQVETQAPLIQLSVVVMQSNLTEVPDILRMTSTLGIRYVVLRPIESCHPSLADEICTQEQLNQLFTDTQILASELGIKLYAPTLGHNHYNHGKRRHKQKTNCRWPWVSMFITVEGFVTPCCNIADPAICVLGNVFDEPLKRIWNNSLYQTGRIMLRKRETAPGMCQACPNL